MIVVPAVDVRNGRVVRLKQGRLREETVYGADPLEAAANWVAQGAQRLHVVDLDAAVGEPPQTETLADMIRASSVPVEVGGGVRTTEVAVCYLEAGADRVILGTAAIKNPEVLCEVLARAPAAVAVALDARDGQVAVAGWREITTVYAVDLAARVREWGVQRLQYTDVVRDGTLVGPNIPAIETIARASRLKITAAGGVARLDDLERLKELDALGVDEVIVGKALYEKRFTLAEATARLAGHA